MRVHVCLCTCVHKLSVGMHLCVHEHLYIQRYFYVCGNMVIVTTIQTKKNIRSEFQYTAVTDDIITLMFNGFNDQFNDLIRLLGRLGPACGFVYENCLCHSVSSVSGRSPIAHSSDC